MIHSSQSQKVAITMAQLFALIAAAKFRKVTHFLKAMKSRLVPSPTVVKNAGRSL